MRGPKTAHPPVDTRRRDPAQPRPSAPVASRTPYPATENPKREPPPAGRQTPFQCLRTYWSATRGLTNVEPTRGGRTVHSALPSDLGCHRLGQRAPNLRQPPKPNRQNPVETQSLANPRNPLDGGHATLTGGPRTAKLAVQRGRIRRSCPGEAAAPSRLLTVSQVVANPTPARDALDACTASVRGGTPAGVLTPHQRK